jgi:hypothetical protein
MILYIQNRPSVGSVEYRRYLARRRVCKYTAALAIVYLPLINTIVFGISSGIVIVVYIAGVDISSDTVLIFLVD